MKTFIVVILSFVIAILAMALTQSPIVGFGVLLFILLIAVLKADEKKAKS